MNDQKTASTFTLRQAVVTLEHKAHPDGLYVEDILATFGPRGHALLILFFSIPFTQPIPLLGLSTPFGIAIASLGLCQAINRRPWLPKTLLRRHLRPKLILSCCRVLSRLLEKTEKLIKPRFGFWLGLPFVRIGNAFLIAVFAFFLALPLPIPFSNSIPAFFLVLNAIGWLEEDGIVILLSYLLAIGGFVFFGALGAGTVQVFQNFF